MDTTTHARILAAIDTHGGRLTTADALAIGIHKVTLKRASDEGLVDRLARGVYGRPGDGTASLVAAAADAGKAAVLAYRGGATFYQLDAVARVSFEWCVPHGRPTRNPMVHGRRRFDEIAIVEIGGIWVTTIEQTLVDLASFEHPDIVERAVESAIRMKLTTDRALREFANVDAVSRGGGGGGLGVEQAGQDVADGVGDGARHIIDGLIELVGEADYPLVEAQLRG